MRNSWHVGSLKYVAQWQPEDSLVAFEQAGDAKKATMELSGRLYPALSCYFTFSKEPVRLTDAQAGLHVFIKSAGVPVTNLDAWLLTGRPQNDKYICVVSFQVHSIWCKCVLSCLTSHRLHVFLCASNYNFWTAVDPYVRLLVVYRPYIGPRKQCCQHCSASSEAPELCAADHVKAMVPSLILVHTMHSFVKV